MTGADRARLARVASALAPGRARLFHARIEGRAPTALTFEDLDRAPDWLALDHDGRRTLARLAALAGSARALADSIDGAWLGRLADAAGAAGLDWAIALAPGAPPTTSTCDWPPDAIDRAGSALLAAAAPARLAPRLADIPAPCAATARWAVGQAHARILAR